MDFYFFLIYLFVEKCSNRIVNEDLYHPSLNTVFSKKQAKKYKAIL